MYILNEYIRKKERFSINGLSLPLIELGNVEQIKSNIKDEIIKIRYKINKIKDRKK